MRLVDLDPRWLVDRDGRRGVSLLCPHCRAVRVCFTGEWGLSGETFETLSAVPSLKLEDSGHGHWGLTSGEVSGA